MEIKKMKTKEKNACDKNEQPHLKRKIVKRIINMISHITTTTIINYYNNT